MKRRDLLKHLASCGCILRREGKNHSIFFNPVACRFSTVPRHNEINDFLAAKICKDLGIDPTSKK